MKTALLIIAISLLNINLFGQEAHELVIAVEKKDFAAMDEWSVKRGEEPFNFSIEVKRDFVPLVFAIVYELDSVAIELIERGQDVNWMTEAGIGPLEVACRWKKIEIVKLLLAKGAETNPKGCNGNYPIHGALLNNLNTPDESVEILKLLISHGADVNALSKYDEPALFPALDNLKLVKLLVENGADIELRATGLNVYTGRQTTALHEASYRASLNVVKYLIEQGADIHATDANGWTPLHYAAYNGNSATVEYLLSVGANRHAKTFIEWSILTGYSQNPYPAGSTALDLARISMSNFSFEHKKSELEKIMLRLMQK